jgi:hypothetical protein
VCTTTGAPGPYPDPRHPLSDPHALTRSPSLTPHRPHLTQRKVFCRYAQVDVAKAPNRCRTRRSARMRTLRRQSHNTCQRGQKWIREGEGPGGHSEGSREVPMVRAPAGPLGSRSPSRGRSQRRDTGRGPVRRCMHVSTHGSSSSKADARLSRISHASAPENSNGWTSRARERDHFGVQLVLWLQELEESEASVHVAMPHPVTYGKFSSLVIH